MHEYSGLLRQAAEVAARTRRDLLLQPPFDGLQPLEQIREKNCEEHVLRAALPALRRAIESDIRHELGEMFRARGNRRLARLIESRDGQ